ncbi:MAG: segregation/condensation protein A [Candidatus Parcubacteria bacterium]|nr:segregation/condensation protein A [Candidatus Parcubacteria bacterium]
MAQYKVQLEEWQGPLDLLLQLIEQQEMDITKISLSQVAEQFIAYMNTKPLQLEETADFLVVAAKLIYIKSKALLPTLNLEEDDGIDLEKQLKMYKEYLEAAKKIQKILNKKKVCFSKEKFPEGITGQVFYVPKSITISKLQNMFVQVINRIKPIVELPKKVIEKSIKLSERIQHIKDLIFKEVSISFCKMLGDSQSKTEKIVSFLAVLELVKQKVINVEQEELFEDIKMNKI